MLHVSKADGRREENVHAKKCAWTVWYKQNMQAACTLPAYTHACIPSVYTPHAHTNNMDMHIMYRMH
jgi:hypothetical protein